MSVCGWCGTTMDAKFNCYVCDAAELERWRKSDSRWAARARMWKAAAKRWRWHFQFLRSLGLQAIGEQDGLLRDERDAALSELTTVKEAYARQSAQFHTALGTANAAVGERDRLRAALEAVVNLDAAAFSVVDAQQIARAALGKP